MKFLPRVSVLRPRGFSLIELLVVVGVIAVLVAGAFVVYPMVRDRQQANATILRTTALVAKVESLYINSRGYAGLTTSTVINGKMVPASMLVEEDGEKKIQSAWGGNVEVLPAAGRGWALSFEDVPSKICSAMAANMWRQFSVITINNTTVKANSAVDVNVSAIADGCSADGARLVFGRGPMTAGDIGQPVPPGSDPGTPGGDDGDDTPPPGGGGDDTPPPGGGGDEDNPPGGGGDEDNPPGGGGDEDNPPGGGGDEDNPPGGGGDEDNPPGGGEDDPPIDPPPPGGGGDDPPPIDPPPVDPPPVDPPPPTGGGGDDDPPPVDPPPVDPPPAVEAADLNVVVSGPSSVSRITALASYTVVVSNVGAGAATSVSVTMQATTTRAGVIQGTPTGWTCSASVCTLASMGPGGMASFTFQALPRYPVVSGHMEVTATATTGSLETVTANNTDTKTTIITLK